VLYKDHFNLSSPPFGLTPNTRVFFAEGNRKAILDALIYAISHGDGIVQVTGEVGSGKTLLSRMLCESLGEGFQILILLNPGIPPEHILSAIALELGLNIEGRQDKVSLLHDLQAALLTLHKQGKQTVLLIDEAQAIPLESLEEIRRLSNLETGAAKLLQIVLFGQPELDDHLDRHEVRQIKERIVHRFCLPRLTAREVTRYLDFRLRMAGLRGNTPFTPMAARLITTRTRGLLRRINLLAEKCLLAAFLERTTTIDAWLALSVILDVSRHRRVIGTALLLACVSLAALLPTINDRRLLPPATPPPHPLSSNEQPQTVTKPDTPTPVAAKSGDASNESVFFIQLMRIQLTVAQPLMVAVKKRLPAEWQAHAASVQTGVRDHVLFLGPFDSHASAQQILDALPTKLKAYKPLILTRKRIEALYNRQPEQS